jgi:hypothetical protein
VRFLFRKSASSTFDGNLNIRVRRLSSKCVDMTIFHAQAITSSDHSWAGPAQARPEVGRDPTASERALGKVPQPAPQLYRILGLFPLNSDC